MNFLKIILCFLIAQPANAALTGSPLTNSQQSYLKEVNLLENPGFESGIIKWTASGGAFTTDTSSNLGFGVASGKWTPSGSQNLCSNAITIPKGLYGAIGKARIWYKGGDATHYTWAVEDGSSTILQQHLITTSTNFTEDSFSFQVPTSGSLKLCIIASASATVIYLDNMFLGADGRTQVFGSPEINVITNPNDAGNWYSGANITVATTTTTSDLPLGSAASGVLAQTVPTAIKITRASGTNSVYTRWTMPTSLKSRKLKVQWEQHALSGYASGDLTVQVRKNSASDYSGSYTAYTLTTDSSGNTNIPNMDGRFTAYFDADTSDYYELDITAVSGTTALVISNVVVGPGIIPQGAVIGPWISFTPTGAWSANTTYAGFYRRVGEEMEVDVTISTSGAPTSATLTVNIPSGFTINTGALSSSATDGSVQLGFATILDGGTANYPGSVKYNSTTSVSIRIENASSTYSADNVVNATTPITFGNTDKVQLFFRIPINEWAGSGTVNVVQNDVEYAYNTSTADSSDTTSFGYGPVGATLGSFTAARAKRVRFLTPIGATDLLRLEVQKTGINWIAIADAPYRAGLQPYIVQNTTDYGLGLDANSINGTDIDVQFGHYGAANGSTYGSAGAAWANFTGYSWRVVKSKQGQAVGFGNVAQSTSGLVKSAGQLLGTNTNDSAATGYVGEVVTSTVSTLQGQATATWENLTSISLTSGDWLVSGLWRFRAGSNSDIFAAISINSGATTSDHVEGSNTITSYATTSGDVSVAIPQYRVSIAATTTVYQKMKTTAASSSCLGGIKAVRIR